MTTEKVRKRKRKSGKYDRLIAVNLSQAEVAEMDRVLEYLEYKSMDGSFISRNRYIRGLIFADLEKQNSDIDNDHWEPEVFDDDGL